MLPQPRLILERKRREKAERCTFLCNIGDLAVDGNVAGDKRDISEKGEEEGGLAPTRRSVDADEGAGGNGEGDI